MNKRRLLKLADLLEANAKNKKGVKFDLVEWGAIPKKGPVKLDCGTTACAIGLACLSGAFKRQGLTYKIRTNDFGIGYMPVPKFGGRTAWTAVHKFFDLSWSKAGDLFESYSYPVTQWRGAKGEIAVAKRIRAFVAAEM